MTDSGEINEPIELRRDRPLRNRWLALLVAALIAATAIVAFSAGSASAQTQNDSGDSNQQQAGDITSEDSHGADDSDGTCDRGGSHRGSGLGRFGMGETLTEVLGIEAETLWEKLREGSTLADIAAEQGVVVSHVVDALATAVSEKAAEHDREIDTDELTAKITAFVNGEWPERPERSAGWHGRRGGKHQGGMGPGRLGRWGGHGHESPTDLASTSAADAASAAPA